MALEDEFGDVVRKARTGQSLTQQELAQAAGLSRSDIAGIESYMLTPPDAAVRALASVLRLKEAALLGLSSGAYQPPIPDLSLWGSIAVITSEFSGMAVNAFAVWCPQTRKTVLLDTGADCEAVNSFLLANGLSLAVIGLTHTHRDHIACLSQIQRQHPAVVLASEREPVGGAELVQEGFITQVGSLNIRVLETDGHSRGGLTFVIQSPGRPLVAAVGDALFAGSAGGAGVSYTLLMSNLRDKIFKLPGDTLLLPGHGPLTTVAEERLGNPFAP